MNILLIIPNLKKGGAERMVLDILRQFLSLTELKVKLVLFRNEINYAVDDIKAHIQIIPSSVSLSMKRKPILDINELQNYIDDFKPNIIHTHLYEAELVSRFCFYPQAKWFSHVHDNILTLNNFSINSILKKQALTNFYEKKLLFKNYQKNGGTHFISISKHTEKYIKSVQVKYPVTLLHNAINVKRFQKQTNPSLLTLNSQHPTLNLINIGSFNENKNQTFLLDIIVELNKLNQQVNCIFLGDGLLKKIVEKKAYDLKINNQCEFPGNIENVEEYLWKSDIYIHTALSEALGLTILEAMAAGLPVVTLDGGGNRDLFENCKNGFLIKKPNATLFSKKIMFLWKNEKVRIEMGENAEKFASQFSIEKYCDSLIKIYKNEIACVE